MLKPVVPPPPRTPVTMMMKKPSFPWLQQLILCVLLVLGVVVNFWYPPPNGGVGAPTVMIASRQHHQQQQEDPFLWGFFYQSYRQPKATLEVIKSVRRHMPTAPIYMVSSDGYQYQPLADRFPPNFAFSYSPTNSNPKGGSVGGVRLYTERLAAAAEWCNCSYLVVLEDDVVLQKPLLVAPPHDAGGAPAHKWTRNWTKPFRARYAQNWSYHSHGLCGGSYVKARSYLDAYRRTSWDRLQEMGRVFRGVGTGSDITLAVILMDAGYTVRPWDGVYAEIRVFKYRYPADELAHATILHQNKSWYNRAPTPEDGEIFLPGYPKDVGFVHPWETQPK